MVFIKKHILNIKNNIIESYIDKILILKNSKNIKNI